MRATRFLLEIGFFFCQGSFTVTRWEKGSTSRLFFEISYVKQTAFRTKGTLARIPVLIIAQNLISRRYNDVESYLIFNRFRLDEPRIEMKL